MNKTPMPSPLWEGGPAGPDEGHVYGSVPVKRQ